MTDSTTIARLAAGLTKARRDDLTIIWVEFCDADELSNGRDQDAYISDMEQAGFIELADVDGDALDDPFAYERGIEPGGMNYRLTPLGLAVRAFLAGTGEEVDRG